MTAIEMRDVTVKSAKNGTPDVEDVNLTVPDGTILTILGPDGSGKTTILRLLAGLDYPTEGEVLFDDIMVNAVPPRDRDVATVTEDFPLVPHHKGQTSLAFPSKLRRNHNRETLAESVEEVIDELGLHEAAQLRTKAMSDAERQRVALGGALAREANIYVFDEPFSALNERNRGHIRSAVTHRQRSMERTTVITTSDSAEAMALGAPVAVMHQGIIHQTGTVREIYADPVNVFVAAIFGSEPLNLMSGIVQGETLEFALGTLTLPQRLVDMVDEGDTVIAGIRPSHCQRIHDAGHASPHDLHLAGTVGEIQWHGTMQRVLLGFDLDEDTEELFAQIEESVQYTMFQPYLMAQLEASAEIEIEDGIEFTVPGDNVLLFDPLSGDRL